MDKFLETMQGLITTFGVGILTAVVIFLVGRWIANLLRKLTKSIMTKRDIDPTITRFTGNVVFALTMTIIIIAALGQLGIQTASFVAILGVAGLAVGLALQGSLANFAAGFLLVLFRPFKLGDFIEGAGVSGTVENIQIFTTQLKTPDNKLVIIPNSKLTADNITNFSTKDCRRIDLVFGISYDDSLDDARRVIQQVMAGDSRILNEPPSSVNVLELGESQVNLAVRPWVKTADYWDVYFDLNEKIKKRFDTEAIHIPYPQRDIHVFHDGDQYEPQYHTTDTSV